MVINTSEFLAQVPLRVLCLYNGGLYVLVNGFAVMKNPANLAKHQANPKVAPVIAKMMGKFAGPK